MPTAGSTARWCTAARLRSAMTGGAEGPYNQRDGDVPMPKPLLLLALAMPLALAGMPALADPALDALVAAYPDHLASNDGKELIWKDGTRMPISDGRNGKTFQQLLDAPDIRDQFTYPYPLGPEVKTPAINEDPGRIRFEPFFLKMYGDCRKGDVAKRLKRIA